MIIQKRTDYKYSLVRAVVSYRADAALLLLYNI